MFTKIYSVLDRLNKGFGVLEQPITLILRIFVIFVITGVTIRFGKFLIGKFFLNQKRFARNIQLGKMDPKRVDTLMTITASVFTYTVYLMSFISVITYLMEALNLKSVLTLAGIGGVILGFSAQNSIKDMLAGIYILIDDQYAVGDYVTIDGLNGKIEDLELRVTKIRSDNGDMYYFANGDIRKVINHSRGEKAFDLDIPVAYSENTEKVFAIAKEVCEQVKNEIDYFIVPPAVLGITEISKNGYYILKITAKTPANQNWEPERRIRELFIEKFIVAGIPFLDKSRVMIMNEKHNKES